MKTSTRFFLVLILHLALAPGAHAATFPGNGDAGFGGAIGTGSLTLTDDGTNISGTITRGSGNFNDYLVLYLDSVPGGFADTSGFADAYDGFHLAISGFDGSTNRSVLTNAPGFAADYAIAINANFGGLWGLTNGGTGSLPFITSVNLSPTGNPNAASYTFSFPVSAIGLTPGGGGTFQLVGTYVSGTGYRSTEAVAGNVSGTQGWNPFTVTSVTNYTIRATLPPAVTTLAATFVTSTNATLNGTVNPDGAATSYYFQYGLDTSYGSFSPTNTLAATNFNFAVSNALSGLLPGTLYHFTIIASNAVGVSTGSDLTFTTPALAPAVTTLAATFVTSTNATLNGTVNPDGAATSYYLQYGLTTDYGSFSPTNTLAATNFNFAVSNALSGLLPGTLYHFTIIASNSTGVSTGSDLTFTTPALAPAVTTLAATFVTSTNATLNGTVNPDGAATSYYFQYGLDTSYGSFSPTNTLAATNFNYSVNAALAGLQPNTTYHFTVVASNSTGISTGSDLTFTTTAPLPGVTTLVSTGVTNTAATLNGVINPNGFAAGYFFQYGPDTNYGLSTPTNTLAAGGSPVVVSNLISGFAPGLTNHCRLVATNAGGIAYGNDIAFGSPLITLFGAATMTNECHAAFNDPGATNAAGFGLLITGTVQINSPNTTNGLTYTGTNALGGVGIVTRTVIVRDSLPPVITLLGANPLTNLVNQPFVDPGATASDQCAGTVAVTTNSTVNAAFAGFYTVTYTADDGNGNTNTAIRTVVVPPFDPAPVVLNTNDSGFGSLRQAVLNALPGATITFTNTLSGQDILLTSGQIVLGNSVTIDASTLASPVLVNGNAQSRIFYVNTNVTATLNSLIITNGAVVGTNGALINGGGGGYISQPGGSVNGGGIYNNGGTLTLNSCSVLNNASTGGNGASNPDINLYVPYGGGGGGALGGGLYNGTGGNLTLNSCTVNNNRATGGTGGSGYFVGGPGGVGGLGVGGIYNDIGGTLTLNNCSATNNAGNGGTGGSTSNAGSGGLGVGGIYNLGTMTLGNCTVASNTGNGGNGGANNSDAGTGGYGGSCVGGIYNLGTMALSYCAVANNIGTGGSEQSYYHRAPGGAGLGGGIGNDTGGLLMLNQCMVSSNTCNGGSGPSGGGDGNGGGINNNGTATVNSCTLAGNAANGGGADYFYGSAGNAYGGGINNGGTLMLNNSTLANNSAFPGTVSGASDGGGGINNFGTATVNNCTFAYNSANLGGGIYNVTNSIMHLTNSIVCSNTASISGPNLYNEGGVTYLTAAILVDTNAQLSPLGNYGGPTQTMPPLPGSPAIDAGSDSAASQFTTDQRGFARVVGAAVDIGAVEGVYVANYSGPGLLENAAKLGNGAFQFSFTNYPDLNTTFAVWAATNLALPFAQWSNLGAVVDSPPGSGQYQFTDPQATNSAQRFYRVSSP